MLQARIFSYADAHRYRLGTHYEALPINAPKCPMNHYHKDGKMRFFPNFPNPDAYYEPNSFNGPVESPDFSEPPLKISGDADRYNPREGNDDYGQKARLFSNIAEAMQGVPPEIVERQLGHNEKVHPVLLDAAYLLNLFVCKIALSYPSIILEELSLPRSPSE